MATSYLTQPSDRYGDNCLPIVNDLMITHEFLTGTGPQKREFGLESRSTHSMKRSHLTKSALAKIKTLINNGQIKGVVGAGFNPLEKGDSGPWGELKYNNFKYNTAQFTGSAEYHFEVIGNNININITVTNTTSLNSALLHIPIVGKPSRGETPLGIAGNVEQSYSFSIQLSELK